MDGSLRMKIIRATLIRDAACQYVLNPSNLIVADIDFTYTD